MQEYKHKRTKSMAEGRALDYVRQEWARRLEDSDPGESTSEDEKTFIKKMRALPITQTRQLEPGEDVKQHKHWCLCM